MDVEFTPGFNKNVTKLHDRNIKDAIIDAIENIKAANKPGNIHNMEGIKGFKTYFRVRIGDYRIGIRILNNKVYFIKVGHRKDIYKLFP